MADARYSHDRHLQAEATYACGDVAQAVVPLIVAIGVGTFIGARALRNDGDSWLTYRNEVYGYVIKYPKSWDIEASDPIFDADGFELQITRITRRPDEVRVYVNFQGGWCESGACPRRDIVVNEVAGTEYLWDWDEDGRPNEIVWHFPDVRGRNYTVMGRVESDLELVFEIVMSFRFLK